MKIYTAKETSLPYRRPPLPPQCHSLSLPVATPVLPSCRSPHLLDGSVPCCPETTGPATPRRLAPDSLLAWTCASSPDAWQTQPAATEWSSTSSFTAALLPPHLPAAVWCGRPSREHQNLHPSAAVQILAFGSDRYCPSFLSAKFIHVQCLGSMHQYQLLFVTSPRLTSPYLLASASAASLPPEVTCTAQLSVMVAVPQLTHSTHSNTALCSADQVIFNLKESVMRSEGFLLLFVTIDTSLGTH